MIAPINRTNSTGIAVRAGIRGQEPPQKSFSSHIQGRLSASILSSAGRSGSTAVRSAPQVSSATTLAQRQEFVTTTAATGTAKAPTTGSTNTNTPGALFSNAAWVSQGVPLAAAPVAETPVPVAEAHSATTEVGPGFTQKVMNQLAGALTAAGIDPSGLNMTAHDDQAYYPTGSWTNHLITLTANGHTESFMADLTNLNPNVAVTEIKRLMTMG